MSLPSWGTEQTQLVELYQQSRALRLDRAIDHARECVGQPVQIKRHLNNWLTLLTHVHDRPDLHAAALELITILHFSVVSLGYLTEWEPEVRFAIEVCTRSGDAISQIKFLGNLTDILYWSGQFDAAHTSAEQALSVAQKVRDAKALMIGAKALIGVLVTRGQPDLANQVLTTIEADPVVQQSTGSTQAWVMAQLFIHRAMVRRAMGGSGALHEAAFLAKRAMHWLKPFSDSDINLYAHICRNRGVYLWLSDRYDIAIRFLHRSRRLFVEQNDPFDRRLAEGTLGLAYWSSGYLLKAEKYTQRAVQAGRQTNTRWQFALHTGTLVLIALFRGRLVEASRYASRHCRLVERYGAMPEISRARCNRGIVALHLGNYRAALEDIEFDRRYLEQSYPISVGLVTTYANLARCYIGLDNLTEARRYATNAMTLSQQIEKVSLRIIALRVMAECFPDNETGSAIPLLQEALTLAESIDRRIDVAGCLFSLAHLVGDRLLWERAVEILCQMHATEWLRSSTNEPTIDCPPYLPAVV